MTVIAQEGLDNQSRMCEDTTHTTTTEIRKKMTGGSKHSDTQYNFLRISGQHHISNKRV